MRDTVEGFLHGLRRRRPVRPALSRLYRHNFLNFANPLSVYRPLWRAALDAVRGRGDAELVVMHRDPWLAGRECYYPRRRGVLRV